MTWPPPWQGPVPDDALGDYKLPTGGTLTIHRRGSRTFIGATGQDATDLLAQGSDDVRAKRAELTRSATAIFEGLVRGDIEPLRSAAGEGNPQFPLEVAKEVEMLAKGKLTTFAVVGTFATGWPRGDLPASETTLVRLGTTAMYVIRWCCDGQGIGYTEAAHLDFAADTELRSAGPTTLVAWDAVHKIKVQIARDGDLRAERPSPLLTAFRWGVIEDSTGRVFRDARLYPGGAEDWDWGKTGTHHKPGIQIADFEDLLTLHPASVILTRGVQLVLQVPESTVAHARASGAEVLVLQSEDAVAEYNRRARREPVVALIHSTC